MQNEKCGIKEFDYRFKESKPTITLPTNYFATKSKTKPETLLYNINSIINTCDTSNIDFTSGCSNNNAFKPISKRFCDNIILYFVIPEETIKNNKVLQEYVNKVDNTNGTEALPRPEVESIQEITDNTDTWINKLLKEIAPFLAENTEKIKRILNTLGISINKTHINQLVQHTKTIRFDNILKYLYQISISS